VLVFDWLHSIEKNTMLVRLHYFTRMLFYFIVFRCYGQCLILWQATVHMLLEDVHEDSTQDSIETSRIPCNHPDRPLKASRLSQVSRSLCQCIHSTNRVTPSERPFVSRSFELLSVASVQTSQQHIRMPFSVRQVKRFLSKTQIWEDTYNRPDNVAFPSGSYPW